MKTPIQNAFTQREESDEDQRTAFKARETRENPVLKQQCCTETEELGSDVQPGEKKEGDLYSSIVSTPQSLGWISHRP
jgi:hypothetical protein